MSTKAQEAFLEFKKKFRVVVKEEGAVTEIFEITDEHMSEPKALRKFLLFLREKLRENQTVRLEVDKSVWL